MAPRRRFWPSAPLPDSSEISRPSDAKLVTIMTRASPMEAVRDHDVCRVMRRGLVATSAIRRSTSTQGITSRAVNWSEDGSSA